jgi:enoyl-CoA hydratase
VTATGSSQERDLAGLVRQHGDGPVAVLELNRPAVHNTLNRALLDALDRTLDELVRNGTTRAVVIAGAGGKSFCAGADLDELTGLSATQAHELLGRGQRLFDRVQHYPLPVIAAVNGWALGGGFELALACSFIVAATDAKFALPEAGLGLMPGYGGTQRLPRLVGRQLALNLMLTGSRLDAARAFDIGLLPEPPVAAPELLASATQRARDIAGKGPLAVRSILRVVADDGAAAGLHLESALAGMLTASAEAAEGIAAFKDRRAPKFR